MDNMSERDLQKMLSYQEQASTEIELIKTDSSNKPVQSDTDLNALDYIKTLEKAHGMLKSVSEPQNTTMPPLQMGHISSERLHNPLPRNKKTKVKSEGWRKITLTDGMELHVQSRRERELKVALEKLIEFSRTLFNEEE